jgi:hypothetical protein
MLSLPSLVLGSLSWGRPLAGDRNKDKRLSAPQPMPQPSALGRICRAKERLTCPSMGAPQGSPTTGEAGRESKLVASHRVRSTAPCLPRFDCPTRQRSAERSNLEGAGLPGTVARRIERATWSTVGSGPVIAKTELVRGRLHGAGNHTVWVALLGTSQQDRRATPSIASFHQRRVSLVWEIACSVCRLASFPLVGGPLIPSIILPLLQRAGVTGIRLKSMRLAPPQLSSCRQ